MIDFKSLDDYYQYLESDQSLLYSLKLPRKLLALREALTDETLKAECTYEYHFVDYPIHKGTLHPKITYSSGEVYPNLSLFKDGLDYIKHRLEGVTNPKYKAKYNQLLWECLKHNQYATQAVDNYYIALRQYLSQSDASGAVDVLILQAIQTHFEVLYSISQNVHYRVEEVLALFHSYVLAEIVDDFRMVSLMSFFIAETKKNEPNVLHSFVSYTQKIIEKNEHSSVTENAHELMIVLAQKLQSDKTHVHERFAEYYIGLAGQHKDNFISHGLYLKALSHYQKAGNRTKVEEVSVTLEKAKGSLNFKTFKTEYTSPTLERYWKAIIKHLDRLIDEGSPSDIYRYLILGKGLIPKAYLLEQYIQPDFMKIAKVMSFDINRNVDVGGTGGINSYFMQLDNFTLPQLVYLFANGFKVGKISYESLIEYLKKSSWIGQDFTVADPDGDTHGFNWIDLIAPALRSFFEQSEIDIVLHKNLEEGYILAVDSLSVKFEGLLRELSRLLGAQTIEHKSDGTEERISFDKLLANEKLLTLPEDDIAYLKFVFTEKGLNLRNNVAHCFFPAKKYKAGLMLLLIVALLRLGNYKFDT